MLLLTFLPNENGQTFRKTMEAWRHGDADYLANGMLSEFRDFPSVAERILTARNRRWIPKLENALASGQTYFVIVGAAHLGGAKGWYHYCAPVAKK